MSDLPRSDGRDRQLVLLVACLAQFMVVLDVAVVNVAIPDMTQSLSLSASGQQWVIDAYTLTFGGLLLLGGRLSDLFGQRRMFLVGVTVFTVFSLLCGLSTNETTIEVFRGLQGVGGAILAPTSLSLITVAFTDPHERGKAIGAWSAVSAGGAAAGVLIGGVLTSALDWRWVFFINIPVGIAVFLVTASGVHVPRVTRKVRLDVPGAVLITAALALVLYAVIGVAGRGWGSPTTIWLLVAGAAALVAFLLVQARFAADPLLPLGLLRDRQRASANVLFMVIGAVIFFLYFDVSVHLQRVDGDSPLRAGLSFLPVALATTVAALNGRRILAVLGARTQLFLAMVLAAVGLVWISGIGVHGEYWTHVGLPMIVLGVGLGMSFVPATVAATAGVPSDQAGIASGLVNTSRQVGGAIGLAAL
ncbi:MFS transporter, partial [Pseudonocardia pini]|uniref:MFS transporter n=1 Tax=Pseudonocardia pini TaxID=2758030 RepID=UPI0015F0ACCD